MTAALAGLLTAGQLAGLSRGYSFSADTNLNGTPGTFISVYHHTGRQFYFGTRFKF